jgi:hypothetical protein
MSEPSVTLIFHNEEVNEPSIDTVKEPVEVELKDVKVYQFTNMIENLVQIVIESFKDKHIDENNIIDFVVKAMMLVETQKKLSGQDKKNVVVKILFRLVELTTLDNNRKTSIKFLIETLAPNMIDTIVSASKGVLDLNKSKNNFCCC